MNNPYKSGDYYKKTYVINNMNLEQSTKWMMNYFFVVKKLFKKLNKYKNKEILEIGSGFGGFINILNSHNFKHITASDMSEIIFSKELNNEHLIIDLTNDYEIRKTYAIIFAFDVMEHINDTEKAIKKIYQLLDGDGIFIFSTPYPIKKHLLDKYHTNMQYPNYYTNILKQKSFELIEMQNITFIPLIWRFKMPLFLKKIFKNKFCISETFFVFKKIDALETN